MESSKSDVRYKKLDECRNYHNAFITELGISPSDFNIKVPFKNFQGDTVVGIFSSEFKKEKGFYFELVNKETYDPLNPKDRKIYKIPYNPNFEEEYELNAKGMYLVPLMELKSLSQDNHIKDNTKTIDKSIVNIEQQSPMISNDDAPLSDLTIKDIVAIFFEMPVSNKLWLNEIIKRKK